MYGSGLRLGEAINARIEDFDIANKVFIVKNGKGAKDRIVNLSDKFISDFQDFTANRSTGWLFESKYGKHLTARAVQSVVKNALSGAGISKKAHPHTLRISYATHLIENGTDISYVQRLLGHSDIRTTRGYLRLDKNSIRKVKSPLDE